MMIDYYEEFLDRWFGEVTKLGINFSDMKLDHLGYTTSSSKEYDQLKAELLNISELIREAVVSNRKVGIFKLFTPLIYKEHEIQAIELLEPVEGEEKYSGFEHAEFTTDMPLEELVRTYSNLNWITKDMDRVEYPRLKILLPQGMEIKFNRKSILE